MGGLQGEDGPFPLATLLQLIKGKRSRSRISVWGTAFEDDATSNAIINSSILSNPGALKSQCAGDSSIVKHLSFKNAYN